MSDKELEGYDKYSLGGCIRQKLLCSADVFINPVPPPEVPVIARGDSTRLLAEFYKSKAPIAESVFVETVTIRLQEWHLDEVKQRHD